MARVSSWRSDQLRLLSLEAQFPSGCPIKEQYHEGLDKHGALQNGYNHCVVSDLSEANISTWLD